MSQNIVASVAARYLQIPLQVQPDYGDPEDTQAAVPRGKEAGYGSTSGYVEDAISDAQGKLELAKGGLYYRLWDRSGGRDAQGNPILDADEHKKAKEAYERLKDAEDDTQKAYVLLRDIDLQFSGRGRHASDRTAFNKFNPDELLAALVDILEKYDLDDEADAVKKLTPTIQRAWRNRER